MSTMHNVQTVYPVPGQPGVFRPAGHQHAEPPTVAAPAVTTVRSAAPAPGRPASASDQQRRDAIMALPEAVGVEAAAEAIWRQGATVDQARAMLPALQTDYGRGVAIAKRAAGGGGVRLSGATPAQRADFEAGVAIARRFGAAAPASTLPHPVAGPTSQPSGAMTDRERGEAIARNYGR